MSNLPTQYQEYIHLSRYARWLPEEKRRETWDESVERYCTFFDHLMDETTQLHIRKAIKDLEVVPSMRALMCAGPALARDHAAGYNCWGVVVDHPRVFDESLYILLCGGGVGFSVERQFINKLPEVPEELHETDTIIKIADSKIGWAKGLKELLSLLYSGTVPRWDVSGVRPAGAKLKTFGGRASGPEPLESLFKFTIRTFRGARGRKLTSIECHDLMCKIADIVVVGGVRRAALLSLSNLSDDRMKRAKYGQWWEGVTEVRRLANNSVCYTEKPDFESFLSEWKTLYKSKAGERGIFNRVSAQSKAESTDRRESDHQFICNPCSEIILRPFQACNLSEVIVRPEDTLDTLKSKVRLATILGTLQATLTDFRYLRPIYQKNCEEERLLGVSLTGIMDHPVLSNTDVSIKDEYGNPAVELFLGYPPTAKFKLESVLRALRHVAIDTNKEWSERLGINQATSITCVKPSGTVSQLCDSSSGIHPRFSKHYIRRVISDKKDPIGLMMIAQGMPALEDTNNFYFEFPIKAPKDSVVDITALEQLELWKIYQDFWCEHKPSQTVYYTDDEFMEVGSWVWRNFDDVSGISFFPKDDHVYDNAPYEAIPEEEYERRLATIPKLDWSKLSEFEQDDMTTSSQELACSAAGGCEI